jgi:Baseplate J-like protein
VILPAKIKLDTQEAAQLMADLLARRPGYVPEWLPSEAGADVAVAQVAARYLQAILQRLNQAPYKNELAFLDLTGVRLIPAQAARAPVVFRLSDNAADARVPAGTRVAAPPPPERNDQIIFETERATGLAAAKLKGVISLWPGRDQYLDNSAAFLAGQAFQPFKKNQLQDTPHLLYLAHDTLLALAGKSSIDVAFELTTTSGERLDILWEYWDGKVWREFLGMRPACEEEEANKLDSTAGLTRSGRLRLQTDCAETSKTTVNGMEAFWVRGRLTEPLPPNPARMLPEVESIKLGTEIAQPLALSMRAMGKPIEGRQVFVRVRDEAGIPLRGIKVTQRSISMSQTKLQLTDVNGECKFLITAPGSYTVAVSVGELQQSETFTIPDFDHAQEITFSLVTKGLSLDKAFSDGMTIDVTKPFFPLGLQPQPGASFYFTNAEVFTKPSAKVRIYIQTAETPQDQLTGGQSKPLLHNVNWEYWNGRSWAPLPQLSYTNGPTAPNAASPNDFSGTGVIDLTVPPDMAMTKVNDQDGLWMRVRLLSGGYGFKNQVVFQDPHNEFTYVITQPPALSKFLLGYTWQYGPFHPEHVLAYNDFHYEDRTEEATWPGRTFQPFRPVSDLTPALYLGFDKRLPVDRLGIFFDIVEQRGETDRPALLWQYWDGGTWQDIVVEDETRNLRLPGLVALIGPDDSQPLARFDTPLHWLRTRLKEDGPPGEPTINGIFPNAVWTVQQQTIVDEPIGASTGQPNQIFTFRQIPVLAGERIDVREVAGLRANVEWRIVAREIFGGEARALSELEAMLASEGAKTDVEKGDLRLVRDRQKRVTEVWVRWQGKQHLLFSGPNDRHYAVERARGKLLFGDGELGKIPPLGAAIAARQYRTGGGLSGNVPARAISQVLGPIGGIESAFNPRPAEGGADGEMPESLATRGPQTIRHRGRALAPQDYETMAREANASVAVARAVPCRDPGGRQSPGWVTLVIIPQSAEPRPWPSFGLREEVQKFTGARAAADLAAANHIYVTGPDYLPVDVEATLVPLDPAGAGAVEERTRHALETFLHPLRGGPNGRGWVPGRDVFLSDVASVLERVEGVDYVQELALLLNGALQGERVRVAEDRIVVAGNIRLKLIEG